MKKVIFTLFIILLLPVFVFAADDSLKDQVNSQVTQLAAMIGDQYSEEYTEARGIQIFRNKKTDSTVAVAVFTIEGMGDGNGYSQVMAVFADLGDLSEEKKHKMSLIDFMVIGGKGIRGIEFDKIKIHQSRYDIIITVPTAEYGPKDAMCCPSIKSEAKFIIFPEFGGRLKEITKKKRK